MAQSIAAMAAVFAAVVAGGFLAALVANSSTRGGVLRRLFACRGCGAIPAPRDLAPLLNWFLCRARCRRCGAGAWVGWPALPGVVLAASLTALVGALGRGGGTLRANAATPLAFGPCVALATWLAVPCGPLLGSRA